MAAEKIETSFLGNVRPELKSGLIIDLTELQGESNASIDSAIKMLSRRLRGPNGEIPESITSEQLAAYEKVLHQVLVKLDSLLDANDEGSIIAEAQQTLKSLEVDEKGFVEKEGEGYKETNVAGPASIEDALNTLYGQMMFIAGEVGKEKQKRAGTFVEVKEKQETSLEGFKPDQYINEELTQKDGKTTKYGDVRKRITETFGRTGATLRSDYNPTTTGEVELDRKIVNEAIVDLETEMAYVAGEPAKVALIRDVVISGLRKVDEALDEKQKDILKNKDKNVYEKFVASINNKTAPIYGPLQSRSESIKKEVGGITDMATFQRRHQELQSLIEQAQNSLDTIVTALPTEHQRDARTLLESLINKAEGVLKEIDDEAFKAWKDNYFNRVPELSSLVRDIKEAQVASTPYEQQQKLNKLLKSTEVFEKKRDDYKNNLVSSKHADVDKLVDSFIAQANAEIKRLHDALLTDWENGWSSDAEVRRLQDAMTRATGGSLGTIELQITALADAKAALDINSKIRTLDSELKSEAKRRLESLVEKVDNKIKELQKERDAKRAASAKETGERISDLIQQINDFDFGSNDPQLQTLAAKYGVAAGDEFKLRLYKELLKRLAKDYNDYTAMNTEGSAVLAQSYQKAEDKLKELVHAEERKSPSYREERWARIKANKQPVELQINKPEYDEILASINLLEEPERTNEKREWELTVGLWNAYIKGWQSDNDDVRLLWTNINESRKGVKEKIGTQALREFRDIAEVKPLIRQLENYFEEPQDYTASDGHIYKWDYAQMGDPEEKDQKNGAPTLQKRLEQDLADGRITGADPNIQKHLLDALPQFVLVSEMRWPYFAKRYVNYLASPQNHPVDAITDVDPMAGMLYYIRSKGLIDPDNYLLWEILRLPSNPASHSGPRPTDVPLNVHRERPTTLRDQQNKNARTKMGFPANLNKFDAENPEYLPGDAVTKKAKDPNYNVKKALSNDRVLDALEARSFRDQQITLFDEWFTPVRLGDDLKLLPYAYDMVKDDTYLGFTFDDYFTLTEMWNKFLHSAQQPKPLEKGYGPKEAIGDLGAAIAKFKNLFDRLPNGESTRLLDVTIQVYLRYIKNIYDQYDEKFDTSIFKNISTSIVHDEKLTPKQRFAERALTVIKGLETVPEPIRKAVEEILERSSSTDAIDLLSREKGHPIPINNILVKFALPEQNKEANRREKVITSMFRQPTEQEKDKTK